MSIRLQRLSPTATVAVHHRGAHLPGAEDAISEDLAVQIGDGGAGAVIEGSAAALLHLLDGIRAQVAAARSGPRARALADGSLLAVPEAIAQEAGFQVPVAITCPWPSPPPRGPPRSARTRPASRSSSPPPARTRRGGCETCCGAPGPQPCGLAEATVRPSRCCAPRAPAPTSRQR